MSEGLHCVKCLTSRTGDVLGEKCRTLNCDGVIELRPTFASLVDVLPEPMRCPRRDEQGGGLNFPGPDHWQKFKAIDNRVCSYCGSLHPDDMFRLVKVSAEASPDAEYHSVVEIEPSAKDYKTYVHQPGVRNAHEGAIKFYMQHLPRTADDKLDVTDEQQAEYGRAVRSTRQRRNRMMSSKAA